MCRTHVRKTNNKCFERCDVRTLITEATECRLLIGIKILSGLITELYLCKFYFTHTHPSLCSVYIYRMRLNIVFWLRKSPN